MEAKEYFNNGFSCSESMIMWAIDEGLIDKTGLSLATSFSGGMGVGCLCGAIAGAQIILGSQFGRNNIFENDNIARVKANEFIKSFMEKYGATCCRILTKGLEAGSAERKQHCTNMVDECENLVKNLLKSEKSSILK